MACAGLPPAWREFAARGLQQQAARGEDVETDMAAGEGSENAGQQQPELRVGKLKDVVRAALHPQVCMRPAS